jgi:hypothetical protein
MLYGTVVVAVAIVRVMEVAVHQVVHVVAVRHGLVTTSGAMPVVRLVRAARVIGRTVGRVRAIDRELVLVHVARVRVVEMPIVQVVGMSVVAHGRVTAPLSVDVLVAVVLIAGHDRFPLALNAPES